MLSHNLRDSKGKAIFISPSRASFLANLVKFDDEWLRVHGGDGLACSASARIENYYPPTPAHLVLILNMLHVYGGTLYHPKTTLPEAPTLLVLHELSALLKPATSESTVSSYLSLITHALAAVRSLSAKATTEVVMAVFDSGLHDLKLQSSGQSLPPATTPMNPGHPQVDGSPSRISSKSTSNGRRGWKTNSQFILPSLAIGETEAAPETQAGGGRMRMVLHHTQDEDSAADVTMEWLVATRVAGPHVGARYFTWA
ncbi:uncharacterized protein B0H18DRAFT_1205782 [Fomitopsis serialis]|uniref:uncharacterized protein n=1 Tax=Fomitopsis serialis TaxID=139415 RepID=UPI002008C5DA|nr:uncharacterized protein B0H18DRAFT_1205782 [Neoantrodia serialis]KAH9938576.1 hypothetical protein B0H18DRAFT_1205782 [Neoantrodia serialis]